MKWLYVAMAILGGIMAGIQTPINGALGKRIGGIEGALVSFLVGTVCLIVSLQFLGKGNLSGVFSAPKGLLMGGVFGAIYLTCSILSVPRVGVTAAISSIVLGQMLVGMFIDHFGFLGVERNPISLSRLVGILLMMGGLYLVLRRNS